MFLFWGEDQVSWLPSVNIMKTKALTYWNFKKDKNNKKNKLEKQEGQEKQMKSTWCRRRTSGKKQGRRRRRYLYIVKYGFNSSGALGAGG